MGERTRYDVAIVGASIAGCTAATLFGRRGAKVALIERHRDPTPYEKICTRYIQAHATPTIERLGLAPLIEAAGGIRNGIDMWTRWGWVRRPSVNWNSRYPSYGYSIRRKTLDPMLRKMASETAGVELMLGQTVRKLMARGDRITGVELEAKDGRTTEIGAKRTRFPTKAVSHFLP